MTQTKAQRLFTLSTIVSLSSYGLEVGSFVATFWLLVFWRAILTVIALAFAFAMLRRTIGKAFARRIMAADSTFFEQ